MRIFFKIVVNTISIFLTSYLISGISLDGALTALFVAIVLAVLNTFLKPAIVMLTIPLTVFSLGFFLLIINAGLVWLAGRLVPGFEVVSFGTAFWFSMVMYIITFFLEIPEKLRNRQIQIRRYNRNPDDPMMFEDLRKDEEEFEDANIVDEKKADDDFEEL